MNLVTLMVFAFGALVSALVIWPIAKASGRKEQRQIYKELENAQVSTAAGLGTQERRGFS